MSARVAHPFSLQEMRRLARPVAFRPEPDPVARARVCRNLWGCASADDSRAFALREIAEQRERASERWNFDFVREVPRSGGRYAWAPIAGKIPAAYRLPSVVPVKSISMEAVLETARATVPTCHREPHAEASATAERAAATATPLATESTVAPSRASPETVTRQTAISDFFRKKRPLSSSTNRKVEEPAAKRARTSTASSSLQDV